MEATATSQQDYTIPQMLLGAACDLGDSFTAEQLAVAAWKRYPQSFGLRNFEEFYPDHHKVLTCLCGLKGLVGKGLLKRETKSYYSLSPKAKQIGQLVLKGVYVNQNMPFTNGHANGHHATGEEKAKPSNGISRIRHPSEPPTIKLRCRCECISIHLEGKDPKKAQCPQCLRHGLELIQA